MKMPIGTNQGFLNPNTMSDDDWHTLSLECEQTFTPGTPIRQSDLFAGRLAQIEKLTERIRSPGSHAIVYGERGVGKSSLVNVFKFIADQNANRIQYVRVAGLSSDNFASLFEKIFRRIQLRIGIEDSGTIADQYKDKSIKPDDVLYEFSRFPAVTIPIVVIDEFDQINSRVVKQQVAETIKLVSDEGANVTFFIVGIADSVADLIEGHESIGRAVAQVEMPRMSDQEIIEVIIPRIRRLGLKISEDALWECVFISKGLPYYAHLLGLNACKICCEKKLNLIDRSIINFARTRAIEDSNNTIRVNFEDAINSERKSNIFFPVLLACALTRKDPSGKFIAKDVAYVLSEITGQAYSVPAFSYHLDQFASHERGRILEKLGNSRQFRFRFREALTEPYVLMKAKEAGLLTEAIERRYWPKRQADLFSDVW